MNVPQFAAAALAASFAASVIANEQRGQDSQQQDMQQQSSSYSQQSAAGATQHDAEQVRKVQQQLSEKGHDVTADGVWGSQTEQALKDFQQAQGIEATGELNPQTLAALGIDEAQAATGATGTPGATGTSGDASSSR
jgi:peptidoglycan hydrolase-like protein with peptidoglycan-binding domain